MRISVVVPLLNEEGNLRELHGRLVQTLDALQAERQIIFVDDGSTDRSGAVIEEIAASDSTVTGLRFSRNFGHEAASTAGVDYATGDAVVLMDGDLQDPPEVITEMVRKWREGHDIVLAVRRKRQGESRFKKFTSWMFYRILNVLAEVEIPADAGDFRLIDAKVVQALRRMREQDRFFRGMVAWTGFRTVEVLYDRPARRSGETKYRPLKLLLLSVDAAVGFSIKPLRIATATGFLVTLVSLEEAARIFLYKLIWGIDLPGYALLAVGLFFLGGVHMLLLGVIGEYIARIYRQSQNRPLYIVREVVQQQKSLSCPTGFSS
ncbi:MAG TPA: glycosyltransferase family 2 protein [Tepidisphaeraceae bacterium]|jgi:dolichol-phosphate mannosyltransferase